jgi:hypothetical protein
MSTEAIIVVVLILAFAFVIWQWPTISASAKRASMDGYNRGRYGSGPSFMEGFKQNRDIIKSEQQLFTVIRGELKRQGVPENSHFRVVDDQAETLISAANALNIVGCARANKLTRVFLAYEEHIVFGLLFNAQGKWLMYTKP